MNLGFVSVILFYLLTLSLGVLRGRCPVVNFIQKPDCSKIFIKSQCSPTQPCPVGKTCCPGICGSRICVKTTDLLPELQPKPKCPLLPCPPPPRDICPQGYDLDRNGCQTCSCSRISQPHCDPVPIFEPVDCAAVLVVNECSVTKQNCPVGMTCCPGMCGARTCVGFTPVCRPLQCTPPPTGKCPLGVQTDKLGCPTCACKRCPLVKCSAVCANGFAKDRNGCKTCRCKVIPPGKCPLVPFFPPGDCAARLVFRDCSVDLQDCPLGKTCCPGICGSSTCMNTKRCPCGSRCCRLHCQFGYVRDHNGCELCRCKMPICLPRFCANYCRYGYRRMRNGCRSCQCQRRRPYHFNDDDK